MSVVIVDAVERVNSHGNTFVALIVQSDLEIVQSSNGNFYANARKASLPSTLDLQTAKTMLIGKELPGSIEKVECPVYEYMNSDGELLNAHHRYSYVPESNLTEQHQEQYVELEELETETV